MPVSGALSRPREKQFRGTLFGFVALRYEAPLGDWLLKRK
jgi:hypothetical protein